VTSSTAGLSATAPAVRLLRTGDDTLDVFTEALAVAAPLAATAQAARDIEAAADLVRHWRAHALGEDGSRPVRVGQRAVQVILDALAATDRYSDDLALGARARTAGVLALGWLESWSGDQHCPGA